MNYLYASLNAGLFTENWEQAETILDGALDKQDYQTVLTVLYQTRHQKNAYNWTNIQNNYHVPLLYYLMRYHYLSGYEGIDTDECKRTHEEVIQEALTYGLTALVVSCFHASESIEYHDFRLIRILAEKIQQKMNGYINIKIFEEVLENLEDLILSMLEREFHSIFINYPKRLIPNSEWTYNVKRGGWYHPAIDCPPLSVNELEKLQSKFCF